MFTIASILGPLVAKAVDLSDRSRLLTWAADREPTPSTFA